MDPQEVMAKAAEDMAKYGKTEGTFYASHEDWETAPACAYGTMARVMGTTDVGGAVFSGPYSWEGFSDVSKRLARTIERLHPNHPAVIEAGGDEYVTITRYNDHPQTSKEDMVLTFKEAANG